MTDERAVDAAVKQAVGARGPIDILIANAGTGESTPFLKADSAQFRRMFDLNVMGVVHATRAVLGDMIEARLRPHRGQFLGRRAEGLSPT